MSIPIGLTSGFISNPFVWRNPLAAVVYLARQLAELQAPLMVSHLPWMPPFQCSQEASLVVLWDIFQLGFFWVLQVLRGYRNTFWSVFAKAFAAGTSGWQKLTICRSHFQPFFSSSAFFRLELPLFRIPATTQASVVCNASSLSSFGSDLYASYLSSLRLNIDDINANTTCISIRKQHYPVPVSSMLDHLNALLCTRFASTSHVQPADLCSKMTFHPPCKQSRPLQNDRHASGPSVICIPCRLKFTGTQHHYSVSSWKSLRLLPLLLEQ